MNTVNIGGVTIQGEGDMKGVKIEPVEIKRTINRVINVPLPNLDKEMKIMVAMDDNAQKIAVAKIQDLSSQLKKTAIILKTGWSWEFIAR